MTVSEVITKENEDGEIVSYVYPATVIIGALEIEELDENTDTTMSTN